jgi:hypothetical protein
MKTVARRKDVYAEFALIQDAEEYYHCFFDRYTWTEYGTGSLLIDRVIPVPEETYVRGSTHDSDPWRYIAEAYPDYPPGQYLQILSMFYKNREATMLDWLNLLENPTVFLMLWALR